MENIKLEYGMKLLIPVIPIEYSFMGMFGISSSSNEEIETEFIFDKYWGNDTNPMEYKVTCIPIDKSGKFECERFYSSDLVSMIRRGTIKIIN